MTNFAQLTTDIEKAVADAIGQLVRTSRWGESVNVTLPLFYPSGASVCIGVEPTRFGFSVTDNGLAYREADQIGGDRLFSANVAGVVEDIAVWCDSRALLSEARPEALAGAMADVAAASARLAWKVSSKVSKKVQTEIADFLYQRLREIFGGSRVEPHQKLVGPSTKEWEVDVVVHLKDGTAIFQAVSNHHMSVYPAAAMFHDFSLSGPPIASVGVVKSKEAMGAFYNILAQSGNVIEEAQADQAYKDATTWHFG